MAKHNGVRQNEGIMITVAKLALKAGRQFGRLGNIVGVWYCNACFLGNHRRA